jgi:hypothetical protein
MFFKLRNRTGEAKKLSKQVRDYMRHRFILLPEYLDGLRCFEYAGVMNGKPIRGFRIFSPYRAKERNIAISSNFDLEKHPELLFFEGYVDGQGTVYVADRRPPLRFGKAS